MNNWQAIVFVALGTSGSCIVAAGIMERPLGAFTAWGFLLVWSSLTVAIGDGKDRS